MSLMDVGNIQLFSWRNTGPHLTVQWSSVWAVWVLKYNHNHTPRCLVLLSPVFLLWFCIEIPLYYYVLHYTAQPQSCMENGKHSLFCTLHPCFTLRKQRGKPALSLRRTFTWQHQTVVNLRSDTIFYHIWWSMCFRLLVCWYWQYTDK